MGNEEEQRKKLEDYHEFLLQNAAVTFSLEGISRDLKTFIQKKIMYNINTIRHLTSMYRSLSGCTSKEVQNALVNPNYLLNQMLNHVFEEMRTTNMSLNVIIKKMLERESNLNTDSESKER